MTGQWSGKVERVSFPTFGRGFRAVDTGPCGVLCVVNPAIQMKKERKMKNSTAVVSRLTRVLGTIALAAVSSGSIDNNSPNTFFEVTVRPGTSVICGSSPCTVYFEAPAGSGTHNILQDGTVIAGVAIGGQRVHLGQYTNHSVVFRVEGTDLPEAYLSVVGGPE